MIDEAIDALIGAAHHCSQFDKDGDLEPPRCSSCLACDVARIELTRLRTALAARDAELAELRARCEELERCLIGTEGALRVALEFCPKSASKRLGIHLVSVARILAESNPESIDAASTAAREQRCT